ncbi:MAG: hypothetical protein ACREN3_08955, partial [Gemmatimonadaceae bacterium]
MPDSKDPRVGTVGIGSLHGNVEVLPTPRPARARTLTRNLDPIEPERQRAAIESGAQFVQVARR